MAAIHCRQIPWGLLSQMGPEFVAIFYAALIRSVLGFAFVAEDDDEIIGFASGVMHWRKFYREFLRHHALQAARVLMLGIRRGRWSRLLETTRYAASKELPPAELVSIAVEPTARASGIGAELVDCILQEFAARRAQWVRVTAGDANSAANRLYAKMGFRLHSRVEIHPGESAAIYVISPQEASPDAGVRLTPS